MRLLSISKIGNPFAASLVLVSPQYSPSEMLTYIGVVVAVTIAYVNVR